MNTTDLEVLSTMAEEGKLKPVVLSFVCISYHLMFACSPPGDMPAPATGRREFTKRLRPAEEQEGSWKDCVRPDQIEEAACACSSDFDSTHLKYG